MNRIGIDFGGTKIEAAVLDPSGEIIARRRTPNPGAYAAAITATAQLVEAMDRAAECAGGVGVAIPGSVSPLTGMMRNANSTWLNGKPFREDLERALERPVRFANDANCFALSEAVDGAAAGAGVVLGVIIGTGCGSGVVVEGRVIEGVNGIAGEIGHMPLPWPSAEEREGTRCWCGRPSCAETWVSGSGFRRDHEAATGEALPGPEIIDRARAGDAGARASLERYIDRLGRVLAVACDVIDPDVIVLGGGMSNVDELYDRLPGAMRPWMFSDGFETRVTKNRWGDSSGVRGAAWLWRAA